MKATTVTNMSYDLPRAQGDVGGIGVEGDADPVGLEAFL